MARPRAVLCVVAAFLALSLALMVWLVVSHYAGPVSDFDTNDSLSSRAVGDPREPTSPPLTYVAYRDPALHRDIDLPPVGGRRVLAKEQHVLAAIAPLSCDPDSGAIVVDVGASDGPYSVIGAARGCNVFSFELQSACLAQMRTALIHSELLDRVAIIHKPVWDVPDVTVKLADGRTECVEGFHMGSSGIHDFETVSLDSFFRYLIESNKALISFLKVNAEGHEVAILVGGAKLFAERLVKVAIVESLRWHGDTSDGCAAMKRLSFLFDSGYHARCLSGGVAAAADAQTERRFDSAAQWMGACSALSRVSETGAKAFACRDMMFCRAPNCAFH